LKGREKTINEKKKLKLKLNTGGEKGKWSKEGVSKLIFGQGKRWR
jgi:hypothetical protein